MKIGIFKDPEKREVKAAGKSTANVVLVTGENVVTIDDVKDTLMGVNIFHVYRKGLSDDGKGVGFRLNINEKFYRENDSDHFYKYVNSFGDETELRTYYYYINSAGSKVYVNDLTNIVSDSDGRFFYDDKQLKTEVKNAKGLKTVEFTPNQQIKYSYLIDKRTDEIRQLESQIQSYKDTFFKYALFDTSNGKIIEIYTELKALNGESQSAEESDDALTVEQIEKLI